MGIFNYDILENRFQNHSSRIFLVQKANTADLQVKKE